MAKLAEGVMADFKEKKKEEVPHIPHVPALPRTRAPIAAACFSQLHEAKQASEQFEYMKLANGAEGCPSGTEILTFEECRQLGRQPLKP